MRLPVAAVLVALAWPAAADDLLARGEYLTRAGGCFSCHTVPGGAPLAGGRALETPFGTFYSPNITPDPETGIGRWSAADFRRALRNGMRPDGASYFPVFPYPSFSGITDDDLEAMRAYLLSRPPSATIAAERSTGIASPVRESSSQRIRPNSSPAVRAARSRCITRWA